MNEVWAEYYIKEISSLLLFYSQIVARDFVKKCCQAVLFLYLLIYHAVGPSSVINGFCEILRLVQIVWSWDKN